MALRKTKCWQLKSLIIVVVLGGAALLPAAFLPTRKPSSFRTKHSPLMMQNHFIGFDFGTSGARISIVTKNVNKSKETKQTASSYQEVYSNSISWSIKERNKTYDDPQAWMDALHTLLLDVSQTTSFLKTTRSICVSGTSASCLLVDSSYQKFGQVTRRPCMYDHSITTTSTTTTTSSKISSVRAVDLLERYAPSKHTARATTSSLAKLLFWNEELSLSSRRGGGGNEVLAHQADYISMKLMSPCKVWCGSDLQQDSVRRRGITSDWHNCLKLGYDVQNLCWPDWLLSCLQDGAGISSPRSVLPQQVVSPGEPMGVLSNEFCKLYGFPTTANVTIVGGTTDSNAAFFAACGDCNPDNLYGTAVTSLGSTLSIKYMSQSFVEDASRGVYSHRFPTIHYNGSIIKDEDGWLVGGASNVGCAVLRQENFTDDELVLLSNDIDPTIDSSLLYYPLTKPGERFPIADRDRIPILHPKPDNRKDFLHGILQGIATVEQTGYQVLGELGASPKVPNIVWTCGGGAKNDVWLQMRQRQLSSALNNDDGHGPKVVKAQNTEASFGAAILAAASFS